MVVLKYHSRVGLCFFLEACIAPSDIMKISPQGRGFQVRYIWNFLSSVFKETSVFNNVVLASTYGRLPRETEMAILFGVPLGLL